MQQARVKAEDATRQIQRELKDSRPDQHVARFTFFVRWRAVVAAGGFGSCNLSQGTHVIGGRPVLPLPEHERREVASLFGHVRAPAAREAHLIQIIAYPRVPSSEFIVRKISSSGARATVVGFIITSAKSADSSSATNTAPALTKA